MNVRFWEFNQNCRWVKITLRPGQRLTHRKAWQHEEGWSVYEEAWESCIPERQVLTPWEELKADRSTMDMDQGLRTSHEEEIRRPNWKRLNSWQRDYSAEAMGY